MNKETLICYSKLELREKLTELVSLGYELLPCDDPHQALYGILAFHDSKEVEIFWPQFDVAFSKKVKIVSASEYLDFLAEGPFYKCDNPKQLRIGACRYDTENRVSEIRECPVSQFRNFQAEYDRLTQLFAICPTRETSQMINECQEAGQARKIASELILPVDFDKIAGTISTGTLELLGGSTSALKLSGYPQKLTLTPDSGTWSTLQLDDLTGAYIYAPDPFFAPARVESDHDQIKDLLDHTKDHDPFYIDLEEFTKY